jgi:hypothetical protein
MVDQGARRARSLHRLSQYMPCESTRSNRIDVLREDGYLNLSGDLSDIAELWGNANSDVRVLANLFEST